MHIFLSCETLCFNSSIEVNKNTTVEEFIRKQDLPNGTENDWYIIGKGKKLCMCDLFQDGGTYHLIPRLFGGKGGFGSMLRAIGAQIDKTNNREACRDLSGRRMRDVNNEKQMKEWLSKQAEKEKEKEERRKERWERRKAMPNHKFDDPLYDQQRSKVSENLEDALHKGLLKSKSHQSASCTATSSTSESRKRHAATASEPKAKIKKNTEWLGIDIDELSDLDSDENDSVAGVIDGASAAVTDPVSEASNSSSATSTSFSVDTKDADTENSDSHTSENASRKKFIIPLESNNDTEIEAMDFKINVESSKTHSGTGSVIENQKVMTEKKVTHNEEELKVKDNEQQEEVIDLNSYNSAQELEILGLEKLKTELVTRQLKCGGTLQERAQRLYSIRGLTTEQIDPSLFAKPTKSKKKK